MISMLLMILKILGILLLTVLGIILLLVIFVLFVPVRYQVSAHRKKEEETPITANIRITWLLHILNAAFSYPEAQYVRVRVFCFTVFRSNKPKKEPKPKKNSREKNSDVKDKEKAGETRQEQLIESGEEKAWQEQKANKEQEEEKQKEQENQEEQKEGEASKDNEEEHGPKLVGFLKKIWSILKNIKYTISKICDKIKHIVKNIQYYIKIIKSDTFHRAWSVCSAQVFSLLKGILPKKFRGNLLIGTGDPASTGQVLAVYGMLYPLIGNHIDITPDFEQQIVEGELFIKGKITVFRILKTAWIVYFNKDLRRLIKLFKREAA